jgi:hypothetical protein
LRRIPILFLLQFYCLSSLAGVEDPVKTDYGINWITVWLSFFFGLLFTILFRFLNRRSKKIDQRSDPGLPFNGWIIFLGVNLFIRIAIQLYFFWTASYFSKPIWISLASAGGLTLQTLIIYEMFLSLFALAGTGALIYWYLGRRDIFPSMFIYYACFYLIAILSLIWIYRSMNLPENMQGIRRDPIVHIIRIIYVSALLIYVVKSKQVKKTFVYSA